MNNYEIQTKPLEFLWIIKTHKSHVVVRFESDTENIIDPLMPDKQMVYDYCHNTLNKLLNLYDNIFEKFILPEFNKN